MKIKNTLDSSYPHFRSFHHRSLFHVTRAAYNAIVKRAAWPPMSVLDNVAARYNCVLGLSTAIITGKTSRGVMTAFLIAPAVSYRVRSRARARVSCLRNDLYSPATGKNYEHSVGNLCRERTPRRDLADVRTIKRTVVKKKLTIGSRRRRRCRAGMRALVIQSAHGGARRLIFRSWSVDVPALD